MVHRGSSRIWNGEIGVAISIVMIYDFFVGYRGLAIYPKKSWHLTRINDISVSNETKLLVVYAAVILLLAIIGNRCLFPLTLGYYCIIAYTSLSQKDFKIF